MTTIREVAKRADVSAMTVSRVLNNSAHISRKARQRVEAAIAELGYVPNALARSLRFKQTNTLALVLTDITNPFFTTVARGVEDAPAMQASTSSSAIRTNLKANNGKTSRPWRENRSMVCYWCRRGARRRPWSICRNALSPS